MSEWGYQRGLILEKLMKLYWEKIPVHNRQGSASGFTIDVVADGNGHAAFCLWHPSMEEREWNLLGWDSFELSGTELAVVIELVNQIMIALAVNPYRSAKCQS